MASALLRRPFRLVSLRSLHHTAIASTTSNGLHQRVSQVAARWNKLSGYEEIAQLKDAVTTLGTDHQLADIVTLQLTLNVHK